MFDGVSRVPLALLSIVCGWFGCLSVADVMGWRDFFGIVDSPWYAKACLGLLGALIAVLSALLLLSSIFGGDNLSDWWDQLLAKIRSWVVRVEH